MAKKKVLIIDDEEDIVKTLTYVLEDEGYEVVGACNGEEGLHRCREKKPDLILLDLMLPGQSGFRIAQTIKSMDDCAHIPIVVLSCRTAEIDKHVAVKSGVVGYLEKPIDRERLLFYIEDILGQS